MPSAVDSAVVTRDAALAGSGYEAMQSKGTSSVRWQRWSVADAGLLRKGVGSGSCLGSSVMGTCKCRWVGVNCCGFDAESNGKRLGSLSSLRWE